MRVGDRAAVDLRLHGPESDVDLAASLHYEIVSGRGRFASFGIADEIAAMLEAKGDRVAEPARKAWFRAEIDRVATCPAGLDEVSFAREQLIVDATERCLERITEAVVKIGAERVAGHRPDVPFERVRGLGNLMRHACDEVDLGILFRVLKRDVAALRIDASWELDRG